MANTLTSGQTETVSSGQTVDGTIVDDGAELLVQGGGVVDNTTLAGGYEGLQGSDTNTQAESAFQNIYGGGVSVDANITGFGLQLIGQGGEAISTTIVNTDGTIDLNTQEVDAGGVAIGTRLNGTTVENLFGGTGINTTAYGANNKINDRALLIYSGVNAQVDAGIFDFGSIVVEGASTRVDITGGPSFFGPYSGEAVIGTESELELGSANALTNGTIVFGPGGDSTLTIDGDASPTETIAGFYQGDTITIAGAADVSQQTSPGLVQLFFANGNEDDLHITTAVPGGIGVETSGDNTTITSFVAPSLVVGDGDDDQIQQTTSAYLVQDGGQFSVLSGAAALGGEIGSAIGMILSGGIASGNIFNSGGMEEVQSGGSSDGDILYFGATQQVDPGGASDDPVLKGGSLDDNGTAAFGTSSGSPASAAVEALSGSGTVVQAGSGVLTLDGDASQFGGIFDVDGGTLEVGNNANLGAGASIGFSDDSDPTLQFDQALNALPASVISGFATALDIIDLRGVGYSGNTTSTPFSAYEEATIVTSGGATMLAVSSAGQAGSLNLDAATTGSGPLDFSDDGQGGTDITFSTLSAGSFGDLTNDITSAATLANGTYTIFLTSSFPFANGDGTTSGLNSIQALNGATVVLNGEGYATSPLGFGDGAQGLTVGSGPVEIENLGGFIGVTVSGGAHLTVSSNSYTGTDIVSGTLEVADPDGAGMQAITFDSAGGAEALVIDPNAMPVDGGTFTNTLQGFGAEAQQAIDLVGFTDSAGQTSATVTSGVLSVTDGGMTVDFTMVSGGMGPFNTFDDGMGGTIVTADSVACYLTGTSLLTPEGERAVETLVAGQLVVTASGDHRPIRWMGHRAYRGRFLLGRRKLLPVCIRAGALGEQVPARDLWVSPEHAMAIDGVLVPASALVNGISVVQADAMDEVCYWHVELDSHDLLLAEGAPSESFLDTGNRGMFLNAAGVVAPALAPACAPRVEHGPALEAIRERLLALAGVMRAA